MSIKWFRKAAKESLVAMRAANPAAKLMQAQLAVAREAGLVS